MFHFLKSRTTRRNIRKVWSSPPHWIEPERRAPTSRAQIERDRMDRRRWLRDTGIL